MSTEGCVGNKSLQAHAEQESVLVYDGSLEGLLTAIFIAYAEKLHAVEIAESQCLQLRLGQKEIPVKTDIVLAERVHKGICRSCGVNIFEEVKYVSLSDACDKATTIYNFIRYALAQNKPFDCVTCRKKSHCNGLCTRQHSSNPLDDTTHASVHPFSILHKAVFNERHRIIQFLRFEHMEDDLWFARCNPQASVVPLVMDWFVARFNTQPFLIFDEKHNLAGVFEGDSWHLVETDTIALPESSDEEKQMQQAWKLFYKTVAVEARYNPELRRQFMPKRFWRNITEMQEETSSSTTNQSSRQSNISTKVVDAVGDLPCSLLG